MGRAREFDEKAVLEQSLACFWRHGYQACGVRELSDATGLKPQSLYNAFGSKRGLFLAALRRYREHVRASLIPLAAGAAGLRDLRAYVEHFLATLAARDVSACLLVKTAFGEESGDPEIRGEVDASANEVRMAFASVLQRATARGERAAAPTPRQGAALLYAVLHGLSVLGRSGGSPRDISNTLSIAMAALGATMPRRRTP